MSFPRVGIIGGGQLALMLGRAAGQLGVRSVVLDADPQCPALAAVNRVVEGTWRDSAALHAFASEVDVITLENEFVDWEVLRELESRGHRVIPGSETIRWIQDKGIQKETLRRAGVATPEFRCVQSLDEALQVAEAFGWPVVLKARRDGYDGRGNATATDAASLEQGWRTLKRPTNELMVEAFFPFRRELAVMVATSVSGMRRTYPTVETIQKDHICHQTLCPAPVSPDVAEAAAHLAVQAVEAFQGIGVFGVEMFQGTDDGLVVNEMAPRVHNSGHYTIEACACSQFENHIRALLDWPLGDVNLRAPVAVMRNLLGDGAGAGFPTQGWDAALGASGVSIHLYGKRECRLGRKMGHLTVLGEDLQEARDHVEAAASTLRFA